MRGKNPPPRKKLVNTNTTQYPRNPPIEVKLNALHRYFQGCATSLINDKNTPSDTLKESPLTSYGARTASSTDAGYAAGNWSIKENNHRIKNTLASTRLP